MGGARCVGSVYGALRGRACQGQQLDRLGRNTGLQVLSGWASAYGRCGSPGALDGSRAGVSGVRAGRQVVGAGKRRFSAFFDVRFAVALHASGFYRQMQGQSRARVHQSLSIKT